MSSQKPLPISHLDPSDTIKSWDKIKNRVEFIDLQPMNLLLPEVATEDKIRFVFISDTHSKHNMIDLPEGDVLLHGGDMTTVGKPEEFIGFNRWLLDLPYQHKIVIGGNHDIGLDKDSATWSYREGHKELDNCTYLEDETCSVFGYNIFGSPWTPDFGKWAFMKNRRDLKEVWDTIPADTDILMTHGPPLGILDLCRSGDRAGCLHLLDTVMNRLDVKYHLFGHIHETYGALECRGIRFLNGSTCTLRYRADNAPMVFELLKKD